MTAHAAVGVNPIQLEILRHGLLAAAEEMKANLARTAHNPIIYEVLHFSCAVFDRRCRTIAQADGLPGFLGTMGLAVRRVVDDIGEETLRPGDVYLLNDPYEQGTHVNDVTTVEPVFCDDELVAFVATRAHWLEIGAIDPGGSVATTEVVQEGLRLRSVPLYAGGRSNEGVWRMLAGNVRTPERTLGDLRAQVASSRTGARRVREIVARHGAAAVEAGIEEMISRAEQRMRAGIGAMRDGVYTAEGRLDDDCLGNGPLALSVRATVAGETLEVDFDGTGPVNAGPVNAPFAATLCCCRVALKALTSPNRPANDGDFAPLRVRVPEASMVDARDPAPTFAIASLTILLVDLVIHALAQALPDTAIAGDYGNLSAYTLVGSHPVSGEDFIQQEPLYGGSGATRERDGESALITLDNGGCRVLPVEVLEARFPLRMERFELRRDSGGPGRWRGGLGTFRDLRVLGNTTRLMALSDRATDPPWGIDGGRPAAHCTVIVDAGGDAPVTVGKCQARAVPAGTLLSFRAGGGGGCGDPLRREPARVQRDVMAGYVSIEAARREYGVVIDPASLRADAAATQRLRDA